MMALRQQAVDMLSTLSLPEEMIMDFIRRMQTYQQEQQAKRAKEKLNSLMSALEEAEDAAGEEEALHRVKNRYGSLSRALSGIVPPHISMGAEKDKLLRAKYEAVD